LLVNNAEDNVPSGSKVGHAYASVFTLGNLLYEWKPLKSTVGAAVRAAHRLTKLFILL
jgi:hypothetical protein